MRWGSEKGFIYVFLRPLRWIRDHSVSFIPGTENVGGFPINSLDRALLLKGMKFMTSANMVYFPNSALSPWDDRRICCMLYKHELLSAVTIDFPILASCTLVKLGILLELVEISTCKKRRETILHSLLPHVDSVIFSLLWNFVYYSRPDVITEREWRNKI